MLRVLTEGSDHLNQVKSLPAESLKVRHKMNIFKQGFKRILNSQISFHAAHLSFYTLLLIIPLTATAISTLANVTFIGEHVEAWREWVLETVTIGLDENMSEQFLRSVERVRGSTVGWIGLGVSIYTVFMMISSIDSSVQMIWRAQIKPSFKKRILVYVGIPLVLVPGFLFFIISLLTQLMEWFTGPLQILGYLHLFFFLFLLYRFLPNAKVKSGPALIASLVVSLFFVLGQSIYLWASKDLFLYNQIYGSIAVIPLFMLWIYLMWIIFLAGVLLTQSLHIKKA